MKMSRLEKRFINAARHGRSVAQDAERRLPILPYRGRLTYLDIGCGNGMTALHLAERHGFDVTGIDMDPDQIGLAEKAARAREHVHFLVADATALPFDDQAFDIVATNKTTHHIPNWKAVLGEMVRVLRPGGYIIYADLVVPAWLARLGRPVAGGVVGFITRAELDGFIRDHKLSVVREAAGFASYEGVWRSPTVSSAI